MSFKDSGAFKKVLSDLFYAPDEGVQLAFDRIETLWADCQTRHAQTASMIHQAELQIKRNAEQANTWQKRADAVASEGNNEMVKQCLASKAKYDEAVATLREDLASLKQHQSGTWNSYCTAESIVSRMKVQKILLLALPKLQKESFSSYETIASSLFPHLKHLAKAPPSDVPTALEYANLCDIVPVLDSLEESTTNAFKKIVCSDNRVEADALQAYSEKLASAQQKLEAARIAQAEALRTLSSIDAGSTDRRALLQAALETMQEASNLLAVTTIYIDEQLAKHSADE